MRKLSFLGGLVLFAAVPAMAQEYNKWEAGGGYTYIRLDAGAAGTRDCHGGGGTAAVNLNSWLGGAAEVSGCKVTGLASGVSASAVSYLFGPRVTYRRYSRFEPFGEFLFGGAHDSISVSGVGSTTDNAFAFAIGGGVDYKFSDRIAIRLGQADYLYTKFGNNTHQNNARIQAGIIFRFGIR
jgi:opacity protein-like surface antigen